MPTQQGEYIKITPVKISADTYEVKIDGSLDWTNFAKVDEAIQAIFEQNIYKIIINLADTKYISSAGFGTFISSVDTAMKNNGNIIFAATPPAIKEIFDILGLTKILRFAATKDEALELLKKG